MYIMVLHLQLVTYVPEISAAQNGKNENVNSKKKKDTNADTKG